MAYTIQPLSSPPPNYFNICPDQPPQYSTIAKQKLNDQTIPSHPPPPYSDPIVSLVARPAPQIERETIAQNLS
ncbi:unnamed protein product, partial [Rotaria sordida]